MIVWTPLRARQRIGAMLAAGTASLSLVSAIAMLFIGAPAESTPHTPGESTALSCGSLPPVAAQPG